MAKDWPGRPAYTDAYKASYFATRQWVQSIRDWLDDEQLWQAAQQYAERPGELRHDLEGATWISNYSGHLYGGGAPCLPWDCDDSSGDAGSLLALRDETIGYFMQGPGRCSAGRSRS